MRFLRNNKTKENEEKLSQIRKNIIEETAYVLICVSQIKRMFGDRAVEDVMDYKISRGRKIVDTFIEEHK